MTSPEGRNREESSMDDRGELVKHLVQLVGDEGCGGSCDANSVFQDEEGWKLFLCTFMEPWFLGKTVEEAKRGLDAYAHMGFGLS